MSFMIKAMILKIIFVTSFLVDVSYGFDYRKCSRALTRNSYFLAPSITTGFTSSSGGCSALASKAEEKKRFFVINYDKFKNEASMGSGEHLYSFGQLSNCSEAEQLKLNSLLKQNYRFIFSADYDENAYKQMNGYASKVCSAI